MEVKGTGPRKFYPKVFVGSLPGAASALEVQRYFSQFGEINNVIMFYRETDMTSGVLLNRGFCHIEVAHESTVKAILAHGGHFFRGRYLHCAAYKSGDKLREINKYNDETRVILKRVPAGINETQLRCTLEAFGAAKNVYFIPNKIHKMHLEQKAKHEIGLQTAMVQFHDVISAVLIIQQGSLKIGKFRIFCERFVHNHGKNPEKQEIIPSWYNKTKILYGHHQSDNFSQGLDKENENSYSNPIQKSYTKLYCLGYQDVFLEGHIKPTSYQFTNFKSVNKNHEDHGNLLFNVMRKNPERQETNGSTVITGTERRYDKASF
jgi:RNA recognition motif-containing protein